MKTIGLGKLILCIFMLSAFASCQEEEFYEKEFIDTLSEQYERENGTDLTDEETTEDEGSLPGGVDLPGSGDLPDGDDSTDGDDSSTEEEEEETEEPGIVLDDVVDSFEQNENGAKLDILWVIDNSGSMGNDQEALGNNFDAFISEFVNKNIDFQMAITTTDTRPGNAGVAYLDSMDKLTSSALSANKNQFMNDFKELVKVGVRGSASEQGIMASDSFTTKYGNDWLRDEAYYVIIYISDENDFSPGEVSSYLASIQTWKDNNSFIKTYSIVNQNEHGLTRYGYTGYSNFDRYEELTNLTGGVLGDINQDFYSTLLTMGGLISELVDQFPLSETPHDIATLRVTVNGSEVSGWTYDTANNAIKFNEGSIPDANSIVKVYYAKEVTAE